MEGVHSPSLEIFQDMVLGPQLWVALTEQDVGPEGHESCPSLS